MENTYFHNTDLMIAQALMAFYRIVAGKVRGGNGGDGTHRFLKDLLADATGRILMNLRC